MPIPADGKRKLASRETYLIVNQPVANPRPGRPHGRFLQVRGVVDVGPRLPASTAFNCTKAATWFSQAGTQANPDPKGQNLIQVVLGEGIASSAGQRPLAGSGRLRPATRSGSTWATFSLSAGGSASSRA